MPDGGDIVQTDLTGVPSSDEESRSNPPRATTQSVEQVSWPVDDPSEFRPELAPGGDLENLGKEKDNFRVYCEVRTDRVGVITSADDVGYLLLLFLTV